MVRRYINALEDTPERNRLLQYVTLGDTAPGSPFPAGKKEKKKKKTQAKESLKKKKKKVTPGPSHLAPVAAQPPETTAPAGVRRSKRLQPATAVQ